MEELKESPNQNDVIENEDIVSESDDLPTSDSEDDEEISDSEFEQIRFNRDTQRRSVSGETFVPDENYVPIVVEKDETVRQMLLNKLNSIFMFSNLEEDEKLKVVDAIKIRNVEANERVIIEGDEGNELFAVGSGKLR